MQAAKTAGLLTPNIRISEDAQRLIVERFDIAPDGSYLAFEDCCSLDGLQPHEKYSGSYEQIAQTLAAFIQPEHQKNDLKEFFKSLVLSTIIRNGDAHRKNFGIIYTTSKDARLSPAFDIVTTTPYFQKDNLALQINGTKRWPNRKKLILFALNRCKTSPEEAEKIIDQVAEAVEQTRKTIPSIIRTSPDEETKNTLTAMLSAWEEGLKDMGKHRNRLCDTGALVQNQANQANQA